MLRVLDQLKRAYPAVASGSGATLRNFSSGEICTLLSRQAVKQKRNLTHQAVQLRPFTTRRLRAFVKLLSLSKVKNKSLSPTQREQSDWRWIHLEELD